MAPTAGGITWRRIKVASWSRAREQADSKACWEFSEKSVGCRMVRIAVMVPSLHSRGSQDANIARQEGRCI
jgi:hypothetical protein